MLLDILKEDQERIAGERATTGAFLTNFEIHWESLEADIDGAQSLVSRVDPTNGQVEDKVRHQLNRAILEQVLIVVDGPVVNAHMKQPFAVIQDTGFRK